MKKAIAVMIAANMLVSSFAPYACGAVSERAAYGGTAAYGETDIKALVADVKSKIDIPDTLVEFESGKSTYKDMTTYELSWHDKEYENSVDVYVNDRGDITSYHKYFAKNAGSFRDRYAITALTDDEIKSMAKAWFADIGVSFAGEIDFDNAEIRLNADDADICVNIPRKVNGVDFSDNYVMLNIGKANKEIASYYSNWNYSGVPTAENVVAAEEAQEKYKQSGALELVYETDYGNDEKTAVLRYKISDKMIDAKTGQVQTNDVYYGRGDLASGETENAYADKESASLTAEEIEKISELTKLISEKEAEKIALSLENTVLGKYGVNAYNYNKYGDKYTVDIGMSDENDSYANVTLDAVTGDVITVFIPDYAYDRFEKGAELSEKEVKTAADAFVEKYNPKKSQYTYYKCSGNTAEYVRTVNGIPFYDNRVTVSVNPKDKTICSYSISYTDGVEFETPDGILSEGEAYAQLFKNGGFHLYYEEFGVDGQDIKLVYRPRGDARYVNAHSGDIGELYDGVKIYPTDMEGHYAKTAVDALIRNGVIELTEDKFKPDDVLSQKDALETLSAFYGWYSPRTGKDVDDFYKSIIRRGFILAEEKNPDELVKREKAVKYIVGAIGYGDIKYISDSVFDCGFNDSRFISAEYNRYVAAARGLGIVNGDENGNFNPQENVTKGQFAVMIYNALSNNCQQ